MLPLSLHDALPIFAVSLWIIICCTPPAPTCAAGLGDRPKQRPLMSRLSSSPVRSRNGASWSGALRHCSEMVARKFLSNNFYRMSVMDALFTRYLMVAFYLACAGGLL